MDHQCIASPAVELGGKSNDDTSGQTGKSVHGPGCGGSWDAVAIAIARVDAASVYTLPQ